MKRLFGFLMSLVFFFVLSVATSNAEISNGYRMGMLNKVSASGWIAKSTECQLSMGVDGTPMVLTWTTTDDKGRVTNHKNMINPWKFTYKGPRKIGEFIGTYMVIPYEKEYFRNWFTEDTPYIVKDFLPIEETPLPENMATSKEYDAKKSEGALVGRIVQASYHGRVFKTYEATVQVGIGGGQYQFMTMADEVIYNFGVEALKRGTLLKISYVDLGVMNQITTANNSYRITKLEMVEKPKF